MNRFIKFLFKVNVLMITLLFLSNITFACTDFRIIANDKSVLITRSMEFTEELNSNLRTALRGSVFKNTTPNGKLGLTWKTKYGYLFVDGFNTTATIDGLNEKGLSFEFLYLPGETTYPKVPEGKENQAFAYFYLGDWVLGNFSTVDEVKNALKDVIIYEEPITSLGNRIFPLHAAIYDENGKGIVIEFVDGKMNVFDNDIGILTNSPTYDWHLINLRNYLNLSAYNPNPVKEDNMTFIATGQGAGMVGLPGDVSPPSRFVKTALLLKNASVVANASEAVNLGEHIINNVDIPRGIVRAKTNGSDATETTQWVVFKDLTQRKFYYRTYDNMTLRAVSLNDLDFSEQGPSLSLPMKTVSYYEDVTQKLKQSKNK